MFFNKFYLNFFLSFLKSHHDFQLLIKLIIIGKETFMALPSFIQETKTLVSKYCSPLRRNVTCIPTLVRAKGQKILFLNLFTNID